MSPRALSALTAAALLLAACSPVPGVVSEGDANEATSIALSAPSDTCHLVTESEISETVGEPVTETRPAVDNCTWAFGEFDSINLRVENRADPELEGPHIAFPQGEDVTGLGDRAYWVADGKILYFVTAGVAYAVQLVLSSEAAVDDPRAVAEQIARKALDRI